MTHLNLIIQRDEDNPDEALFFVEGMAGEHAYRFLLDTGSARTTMIYDDYTGSFPSMGREDSAGTLGDSQQDIILLPNLTIGPIERAHQRVARLPADADHAYNLLGMDILKDYVCQFDFTAGRVTLNPAEQPPGPTLPLTLDDRFHPYLDVAFDTVTAHAVWDTGASLTLVDQAFIDRYPALFTEAGHTTGTDATGATRHTPQYMMPACTIGRGQFEAVRAAAVPLGHVNANIDIPIDIIFGYNGVTQATWWFDFPRRQWTLID
jgi:hypothetical protein